jgi:SAM-dependent methyltransferase
MGGSDAVVTKLTAAEAYERFLVPNVFRPWAELVIGEATFLPGQRVLDIACGPGTATRLAAAAVGRHGRVVGADIDETMLAVARGLTVAPDAAPIEWRQADAMSLPFADAGFDVVLCFEGVQFFPDRAKGLAEIRRVLTNEGRLIGTLWGPLEENAGYRALAEGLIRFVSADAGRLPPFSLADPATIRTLLAGAGFERIRIEPRRISRPVPSASAFVDWVAAGAPTTRHRLALLADDRRAEFLAFVEKRLASHLRNGALQMPYMRHVIEARAGSRRHS